MKYNKPADPALIWFKLKNYRYLDDLNCREFYYELEMRSEILRESRTRSRKEGFWYLQIIDNQCPNVSQYGHDWRLLPNQSTFDRAPLFSARKQYPKLNGLSLLRPLSQMDLEALLEDVEGIASDNTDDLKVKYRENYKAIPLNMIFDAAGLNQQEFYAGIDLSFSDEKLIEALKNNLPIWREQLNIRNKDASHGSNQKLRRKLREFYSKKVIPLMDILFFYQYNQLPNPKSSAIFKLLDYQESGELNFGKTVYPAYTDLLQDPQLIRSLNHLIDSDSLSNTPIVAI